MVRILLTVGLAESVVPAAPFHSVPPSRTVVPLLLGLVLLCLFSGWVAYPIIIALMARGRKPPEAPLEAGREPTVAVVVATREPPEAVRTRIADLQRAEYPSDRLTIIIGVDALAPHPLEAYETALGSVATIVRGDGPGGKAAALNAGVRAARGKVVVFADSQQSFGVGAVRSLVASVWTGPYAGVSGVVTQGSESPVDRWYRRYDLAIRRSQAARWSLVTTSGAIAAIRRDEWRPLPAGLICDDLYMAMQLGMRGKRVGLCEEAQASDPRVFRRNQQFQRRVRTLTGLIQFIAWFPAVLLPWRNRSWGHFVFHKILRLATPYLVLLVVGVTAWALADWGSIRIALLVMLGLFLLLAAWGGGRRWLGQVGWAGSLLAAPVVAMVHASRGRWTVWPHQSTGTQ